MSTISHGPLNSTAPPAEVTSVFDTTISFSTTDTIDSSTALSMASVLNTTTATNTTMPTNTSTLPEQQVGLLGRVYLSDCGRFAGSPYTSCQIAYFVIRIVPIVLLLVGTIGNTINILILRRPRIKKHSSTVYLQFLACSDLASVWTTLIHSTPLRIWRFNIADQSIVVCVLHEWLMNTAGYVSVWLMTSISIERAIMTVFPLVGKTKITRTKSLVAAIINFVVNFMVLGVFTMIRQVIIKPPTPPNETFKCFLTYTNPTFGLYFDIWRLGFGVIIPSSIIVFCNVAIVFTLTIQRMKVQRQTGVDKTRALTKTLLFITTYFIITIIPFSTYRIILGSFSTDSSDEDVSIMVLVYDCIYYVGTANFAINFIFYFMSGTMFKREWSEMTGPLRLRLAKMFRRTAVQDNGYKADDKPCGSVPVSTIEPVTNTTGVTDITT